MPSKLRRAIGTVKDQTSIGLAVVTGSSDLDVAVLKATNHDELPMEDRHVNAALIHAASSPSSAAALVQALCRRIARTRSWVVALKSLALAHRALRDGGPYFPRECYAAGRRSGGGPTVTRLFDLSSFRDESSRSSPWDFTAFVRTLAVYLDTRLECFLLGKLHRYHGAGRGTGLSNMKPPMVLDRIVHWQRLIDRAIGTRPTGPAKTNRLVQITLYPVIRESFDLYRDVSDGLSMLLDNFFHLNSSACAETFQVCARTAKQFEELDAFYVQCKDIGVGRNSEYPSVHKISNTLLATLRDSLKGNHSHSQISSPSLPSTAPLPRHRSDDISHRLSDRESVASDQNWPTVRSSSSTYYDADAAPPDINKQHQQQPSWASSSDGWELVLVETAAKSTSSADGVRPPPSAAGDSWGRSMSYQIPHSYSNPFLNDGDDTSLAASELPEPPLTEPHPTFRSALEYSKERCPIPAPLPAALRPPKANERAAPPALRVTQQNKEPQTLQAAVSNLERKLLSPMYRVHAMEPTEGRTPPPSFRAATMPDADRTLSSPNSRMTRGDEGRRINPPPTFRATRSDEGRTTMQTPTFQSAMDDEGRTLTLSHTFQSARGGDGRTMIKSPSFQSGMGDDGRMAKGDEGRIITPSRTFQSARGDNGRMMMSSPNFQAERGDEGRTSTTSSAFRAMGDEGRTMTSSCSFQSVRGDEGRMMMSLPNFQEVWRNEGRMTMPSSTFQAAMGDEGRTLTQSFQSVRGDEGRTMMPSPSFQAVWSYEGRTAMPSATFQAGMVDDGRMMTSSGSFQSARGDESRTMTPSRSFQSARDNEGRTMMLTPNFQMARDDEWITMMASPSFQSGRGDKGRRMMPSPSFQLARGDEVRAVMPSPSFQVARGDVGRTMTPPPTFQLARGDEGRRPMPSPSFRAARGDEGRTAMSTPSPTFRAMYANASEETARMNQERDPFAETDSVQRSDEWMRQKMLIREQQMWLQQQSKIIAKNIVA